MRRPEYTKFIGTIRFYFTEASTSKRDMQKKAINKRRDGYSARVIKAGPWHGKETGGLKKGKHYYILYVGERRK